MTYKRGQSKQDQHEVSEYRSAVCGQFAKGELAFNDAYYKLTNEPSHLTPRMAAAYLATSKVEHESAKQ